jgi:hypothetical protein
LIEGAAIFSVRQSLLCSCGHEFVVPVAQPRRRLVEDFDRASPKSQESFWATAAAQLRNFSGELLVKPVFSILITHTEN